MSTNKTWTARGEKHMCVVRSEDPTIGLTLNEPGDKTSRLRERIARTRCDSCDRYLPCENRCLVWDSVCDMALIQADQILAMPDIVALLNDDSTLC